MEFGGVSELLWLTSELLAVGSTRGRIAILALQGNKLVERCKKKAHGDGAARVPVQSMDYCPETKRLVSLGQGLNPNSYSEPRQCYAINNIGDDNVPTNTLSLSKTEEIVLGHEDGAPDNRHM
ncbi:hypothetical protein JR316_0005319 [Psilocybe cubensis]|uniref:Uncharacterized protein n=1 Tax=Psilocybe cubensis TaxID=181762 RepID=A0ACB8H7S3_PSICU|nr:hypothetical protein JR316_0005319 [Psilocybe cubensis]KAH9483215.1 hypothetical protein JR316_0005319 [Psilocybe cubensis]